MLVPLDGSEFALQALPTAPVLAERLHAELDAIGIAGADDDAEPVKEFETIRQPFFCTSLSIVGLLIHATVGSFGGDGRRWRNRAGLAA